MGYGVHIKRHGSSIPQEEWLAVLGRDPEMRHEGKFERTNPQTGEAIRISAPGLAAWLSHPAGKPVLFDLSRGRVSVANPDEPTLAKMISIARLLEARVVGDEGETYD